MEDNFPRCAHADCPFGLLNRQVYILQAVGAGAPCRRDDLEPRHRVLAVNEQPVEDIDELHALFEKLEGPLRFRVVDLKGRAQTVTVRPDAHYWPTFFIE